MVLSFYFVFFLTDIRICSSERWSNSSNCEQQEALFLVRFSYASVPRGVGIFVAIGGGTALTAVVGENKLSLFLDVLSLPAGTVCIRDVESRRGERSGG